MPVHPLNIERIACSEGLLTDKKETAGTLAGKIERALDQLREPKWRSLRIPVGVLFVFGGILGFLPLVGFWMLPLGLALLAPDVPLAGRALKKLENIWNWLRRS
jgi:hypothetical protein